MYCSVEPSPGAPGDRHCLGGQAFSGCRFCGSTRGLGALQRQHHPTAIPLGRAEDPRPERWEEVPERRADAEQLKMEEDQMQNHEHEAAVTDPGHTHQYQDMYTLNDDEAKTWAEDGYGDFDHWDWRTSQDSQTGIKVNVKGVSSTFRSGGETRPKNMNVIYIMKVW